jgi:mono/diheme cytochrome c family protein
MIRPFLTVSVLLAGWSIADLQPALAEGDARSGHKLAGEWCESCHDIRPEAGLIWPKAGAPSFRAVAAQKDLSDLALHVWFQSPHPSMPAIKLDASEMDDLAAYILSLRQ